MEPNVNVVEAVLQKNFVLVFIAACVYDVIVRFVIEDHLEKLESNAGGAFFVSIVFLRNGNEKYINVSLMFMMSVERLYTV